MRYILTHKNGIVRRWSSLGTTGTLCSLSSRLVMEVVGPWFIRWQPLSLPSIFRTLCIGSSHMSDSSHLHFQPDRLNIHCELGGHTS